MFAHTHRARFFTRTGSRSTGRLLKSGILVAVLAGLQIGIEAGTKLPNPLNSNDATGKLGTYSTAGGIDQSNPFFQSLGTNGRNLRQLPCFPRRVEHHAARSSGAF